MADATYAEVKTQVYTLSREARRRLVDELSRDLQAEDAPRPSILDFAGALPWDGRDVDERIRLLREEWDDR